MKTIRLLTLMTLALALAASSATASNGYFAHGYGSYYKALAGAGVAFPLNALAPSTNPAALVYVGKRYDVGLGLFSPDRQYSVTGSPSGFPGTFGLAPGTVESGSSLFTIPSFGANWMVGDKSSFGISLYGNGGMNTDYDFPVFGFAPTGVDLSQMFIAPTYSVEVADGHAVGITGILAYQRFEAKGLQAFSPFSSDPTRLTNNDHGSSYGGGARFGYLGILHDAVSVGASYQTKIYMGEFDEYAGLFAEKGDFDIPYTWTIGTAITPNQNLAFLFDVQGIYYNNILSIANPLLPNLATSQLGLEEGAGFGWENTIVYKFGVQYMSHPGLTWRGGYSYEGQPVPESEMLFNIVAPGVVEQHLTFGLSKSVGNGKEITFALMRAFRKEISGPNSLEAPGAQTIGLAMSQWEFDVTFSFGIGN